ncbi:MAG: acyl carrier protein [Clostridiaceae bacterium]|nr:acyl carrier protein [Clostridiaceae bacterium]
MNRETVKNYIVELLQEEYQLPSDANIMEFNYVDSGYIDSLGMLRFYTMIMDEYGIEFEMEEMVDKENHVVKNLVDLVMKKLEG